jgi:hypothetical protein
MKINQQKEILSQKLLPITASNLLSNAISRLAFICCTMPAMLKDEDIVNEDAVIGLTHIMWGIKIDLDEALNAYGSLQKKG